MGWVVSHSGLTACPEGLGFQPQGLEAQMDDGWASSPHGMEAQMVLGWASSPNRLEAQILLVWASSSWVGAKPDPSQPSPHE